LSSTMRTDGRPSVVAVASANACGNGSPAACAASYHAWNWRSGSSSRSLRRSGRARGSVTRSTLDSSRAARASHLDVPAERGAPALAVGSDQPEAVAAGSVDREGADLRAAGREREAQAFQHDLRVAQDADEHGDRLARRE